MPRKPTQPPEPPPEAEDEDQDDLEDLEDQEDDELVEEDEDQEYQEDERPVQFHTIPVETPTSTPSLSRTVDRIAAQRTEKAHKSAVREYDKLLRALATKADQYTMRLVREKPEFVGSVRTGGFLQVYDQWVEIEEIAREHGGEIYRMEVDGPDPDRPGKRLRGKRIKLMPIARPPLTYSTPNGPRLISDAMAAKVAQGEQAVTTSVLDMVREMISTSRADMKDMIASLKESKEPRDNPAELQLQIAKINADTELAKVKALELLDDKKAERDERAAERQRQHEKELKSMELASDKAAADAAERRAEADRITNQMNALVAKMEEGQRKLVETLTTTMGQNNRGSMVKELLEMEELRKVLRGEVDPPDKSAFDKFVDALPGLSESLKTTVKTWRDQSAQGQSPQQPAPDSVPRLPPGTTVAAEMPPDEEPPFVWPPEDATISALATALGTNIELALRAGWRVGRIAAQVLPRFPKGFLDQVSMLSPEKVFEYVVEASPMDAILRSPRGELALRELHSKIKSR